MLHGQGDQKWLKKSYLEDRRKALHDKTGYTDYDLEDLGITGADGGGATDPENQEIDQFPFPIDTTVRARQKVNLKKVMPELGEMSD